MKVWSNVKVIFNKNTTVMRSIHIFTQRRNICPVALRQIRSYCFNYHHHHPSNNQGLWNFTTKLILDDRDCGWILNDFTSNLILNVVCERLSAKLFHQKKHLLFEIDCLLQKKWHVCVNPSHQFQFTLPHIITHHQHFTISPDSNFVIYWCCLHFSRHFNTTASKTTRENCFLSAPSKFDPRSKHSLSVFTRSHNSMPPPLCVRGKTIIDWLTVTTPLSWGWILVPPCIIPFIFSDDNNKMYRFQESGFGFSVDGSGDDDGSCRKDNM